MSTLSITASILNVREHPHRDARVLVKLPRDFRVAQLEVSPDGEWFQVRASTRDGAVDGWIAMQYAARVAGEPTSAAVAAPSAAAPTPKPAPAPSADAGDVPWLKVAYGEIGVLEYAGEKNNPRIVEYHQATTLRAHDDETPWCSAFANWCMRQAGLKGSGEANARSWLTWGRKVDAPVHGCIVVLKRGTSPTSGHVGFYIETHGEKIVVLGGNQSNTVKLSNYPKADVLGYRMPA
jgi:uncharacterized protein (TIGR02594 family)